MYRLVKPCTKKAKSRRQRHRAVLLQQSDDAIPLNRTRNPGQKPYPPITMMFRMMIQDERLSLHNQGVRHDSYRHPGQVEKVEANHRQKQKQLLLLGDIQQNIIIPGLSKKEARFFLLFAHHCSGGRS
jgi:hypothetical protein